MKLKSVLLLSILNVSLAGCAKHMTVDDIDVARQWACACELLCFGRFGIEYLGNGEQNLCADRSGT